jgi:hypothetical protein
MVKQMGVPGAKIVSGILENPKTFVKGADLPAAKKTPAPPDKDFPGKLTVRKFPDGFKDQAEYDKFVARMNQHLRGAGYPDSKTIFQGSSTTGWSPHKKTRFGPNSDYDIALVDPKLFEQAKIRLVKERGTDGRTEPLTDEQINSVGLKRMQRDLQQMAGREVNFMVFADSTSAKGRSPYNIFPAAPRPS